MSNVPAIRFKGFTDSLEQRKLGGAFDYERPNTHIGPTQEYDDTNPTRS